MKKRSTAIFAVALALSIVAGASVFFGANARADDEGRDNGERVRVSGSYDAVFTQFEFLGVSDGIAHLNGEFKGPFELNIGGEVRTGTIVAPLIARLEPSAGEVIGAAVWMFDDGPMCSGEFGGLLVTAEGFAGIDSRMSFECTDGSTLRVRVVETAPPPTPHAEVTGVWVPAGAGGDDDGDEDDD